MDEVLRKKRLFIQTDSVLAMTGFGKAARFMIEYLYKTGKYEIIHLAVGAIANNQELDRMPWKTIGSVNVEQLNEIKRQNDPKNWEGIDRMAGYGAFALDQAVRSEKPDVFIAIQDIWGIDFSVEKGWFNKISSVLWTTLDSVPILPKALELAPKVKNYWSWADFATQAIHKSGHLNVKTVRGPVETKNFFRLSDNDRKNLRKKHNISENAFVIGFVFRNQLRKSVPNLLEGFKLFKKENPKTNAKLLLHTSWAEGWDINKLLEEKGIDKSDIITTYICKNCRNYQIKNHTENEINCPLCRAEKGQVTTHPNIGVSEEQLNEVYNLMDVYCHPFTSGGQEIPIQEAKLTELITLVTNYSCGEDSCADDAASLALDWSEYREPGTQFIKASTYPTSICKQLNKVFNMKPETRKDMGKRARKWVIDNFSVEVIGRVLENFIDKSPFAEDSAFQEDKIPRNPNYQIPEIKDDTEWLIDMYKNILKMEFIDANNEGLKYWIQRLKDKVPRKDIEAYFRKVAFEENVKMNQGQVKFDDFLNKNDKGRVIVVQPKSAGDIFLLTSLFKSIKKLYPDWALYVATEGAYKELLNGNPYVDKWLEYNQMMDNHVWLVGNSTHNGFFNIAYHPYFGTQRTIDYYNNGQDKIDFDISYKE